MRNSRHVIAFLPFALVMVALGCVDQQSRQTLQQGYSALNNRQYEQAISDADQFLAKTPQGQGSADALYLKARALEERATTSKDASQAKADLQEARTTYIQALQQNPPRTLEGRIRAGIANVAYWQDDYQTAAQQWAAAYDKIEDPTAKSYILYRIGLSQQRMGDFTAADQTFASVQQQYAGTDAANRAHEHQGARAYTVQLATFANAATADSNIAQLRKDGFNPTRRVDAQRRVIISIAPVPNYQQALQIKSRLSARYPDALILP